MHSVHEGVRLSPLILTLVFACSEAEPSGGQAGADGQSVGGAAAVAGGGQAALAGRSGGGGTSGAGANGGTPTLAGGAGEAAAGTTAGNAAEGGEGGAAGAGGAATEPQLRRVLAFEFVDIHPETNAPRGHNGSGADEALLLELGAEHGFEVDVTGEAAAFTPANLARYDVVAFCSPHYVGQRLSNENRAALEAFVRAGGGWLGWHYGLHIEKGWPFLKTLGGGATALGHVGGEQKSTYSLVAPAHPVVRGLPTSFQVTDDFLRMSGDPSATNGVTVLATAALSAEPGGDGHPVIWVTAVDQGRAFYSMLGHNGGDFRTPIAKRLMLNALRWASRSRE
jgi:type 1 glutamine amidotransferase